MSNFHVRVDGDFVVLLLWYGLYRAITCRMCQTYVALLSSIHLGTVLISGVFCSSQDFLLDTKIGEGLRNVHVLKACPSPGLLPHVPKTEGKIKN